MISMGWIVIGVLIGIGLILAPLVLMMILGGAKILLELFIGFVASLWRLTVVSAPALAGGVLGFAVDLYYGAPPYTFTFAGLFAGTAVAFFLNERKLWSKD